MSARDNFYTFYHCHMDTDHFVQLVLLVHTVFFSYLFLLAHLKQLVYLRSEEHTSELQSRFDLVCRLLLEKKNNCNYMIFSELIINTIIIYKYILYNVI